MHRPLSLSRRRPRPGLYLQAALQDVSGGVVVSICNVATERAYMRTDTEGLLYILTTLRTFLRGVVRGNGNHLTLSTFSLSFKQLSKYPPGCIGNRESQTMVTYHVGNFQVFNGNGLIAVDIIVGSFMEGILTLVRNPELIERMGRAGRKHVQETFSWEQTVDAFRLAIVHLVD